MRKSSVDLFRRYLSARSLPAAEQPRIPKPAITISRQTGAGAVTVTHLVARQLDLDCQGDPPCPWVVFDRDLVSKILEDHNLSREIEEFMQKAVQYAIQLARLVRAKLTLLHVVPEPSALDYTMQGIPVDEIQGWKNEAETKLESELARAKLAYQEVDSALTMALHPRDEIVRAATQLPADLLVLSTHGYTG